MISTHRVCQLHNLEHACLSKVAQLRRGALNLARIGNDKGAGYQLRRSLQFDRIAKKCRARLEVAND